MKLVYPFTVILRSLEEISDAFSFPSGRSDTRLAAEANAQQILSAGTIYGGPALPRAVCYIYNSGTTTLRLAGTQLADQNGTVQPLVA